MAEQLTPLQTTDTDTEVPIFDMGLGRDSLLETIEKLEPHELIQFWGGFHSSIELPFPSAATMRAGDDLAAVIAGSKPATITLQSEARTPLFHRIYDSGQREEKMGELYLDEVTNGLGYEFLVIGQKNNVVTLGDLYDGRVEADEHFHRAVGEALGYPPEVIDDFVARSSSH